MTRTNRTLLVLGAVAALFIPATAFAPIGSGDTNNNVFECYDDATFTNSVGIYSYPGTCCTDDPPLYNYGTTSDYVKVYVFNGCTFEWNQVQNWWCKHHENNTWVEVDCP